MRIRSAVALLAVIVGAALAEFSPVIGQSESERLPVPTVAAWPFGLERNWVTIEGDVRVRLQIARGSVVEVGVVGQAPAKLSEAVVETLSTWRFESDVSRVLETTVRHRLAGEMGCGRDKNQEITARLPESIEIVSRKFVTVCDPTVSSTQFLDPISRVMGQLRCSCRSKEALVGVRLNLFPDRRGQAQPLRTVLTDASGGFLISGLQPGPYRLEIRHPGLHFSDYRFVLNTNGDGNPIDIEVDPEPEPVRVPQVLAGSIPTYPAAALMEGIQGVAKLRVSFDGDKVLDIDVESASKELAAAAAANVSTWKFRDSTVPVLPITFSYAIDPGDCRQRANPVATMKLPHSVVIRAVRPCQRTPRNDFLTPPARR